MVEAKILLCYILITQEQSKFKYCQNLLWLNLNDTLD